MHQSGQEREHNMHEVQLSWCNAITPRERIGGVSFSCGYCTVFEPLTVVLNNSYKKLGIPVGLVMLVAMGLALVSSFGDEKLPQTNTVVSTQEISDQIFGPYLLPFWALSFVLLAAVVGAIVLARKD